MYNWASEKVSRLYKMRICERKWFGGAATSLSTFNSFISMSIFLDVDYWVSLYHSLFIIYTDRNCFHSHLLLYWLTFMRICGLLLLPLLRWSKRHVFQSLAIIYNNNNGSFNSLLLCIQCNSFWPEVHIFTTHL